MSSENVIQWPTHKRKRAIRKRIQTAIRKGKIKRANQC